MANVLVKYITLVDFEKISKTTTQRNDTHGLKNILRLWSLTLVEAVPYSVYQI